MVYCLRLPVLTFLENALDSGAEPDGDAWHGHRFHPPLMEAVRQHNKQIAELLLEYGAIKGKDCVEMKCLLVGEDY